MLPPAELVVEVSDVLVLLVTPSALEVVEVLCSTEVDVDVVSSTGAEGDCATEEIMSEGSPPEDTAAMMKKLV